MTVRAGSDVAVLLVAGNNMIGTRTEIDYESERITEETTTFGLVNPTHALVGLQKGAFAQRGFFDDAAGSSHAVLVAQTGLPQVVSLGLEGNANGRGVIGFAGPIQSKYQRVVELAKLHRANAEYVVSGPIEHGVIVHGLGAETSASGNSQGASVDNGAATTNGGSAYLQLSALTLGGYTSVTIRIRHSTDNSVFTDLASFTNVTAAPAGERITLPSTVNRYLAVSWTFNGAGSGQNVTFLAGVSRF